MVFKKINPVLEALSYCSSRINSYDTKYILDALCKVHSMHKAELTELAIPTLALERVLGDIPIDEEKLRFYFLDFEEGDTKPVYGFNPGVIILSEMVLSGNTDLDRIVELLHKTTMSERLALLASGIFRKGDGIIKSNIPLPGFFDAVDALIMPLSQKWRIMAVLNKFDEYLDEVASLLKPIVDKIIESKPIYEGVCEHFIEQIDSDEEFLRCMNLKFGATFPDSPDITVYPYLFGSYAAYVWSSDDVSVFPPKFISYFGLMIHNFVEYEGKAISPAALCNVIKSIGDVGRLEMLAYLQNSEVYGQELADKFDLLFTTMSHRVTRLTDANLVNSRNEGTRIYYSMNKKMVYSFLEDLKQYLLGSWTPQSP